MKNLKTLFLIALLHAACIPASAHDIEHEGIYYNFITEGFGFRLEVTYKGDDYAAEEEYSGEIVIPEQLVYNQQLYDVERISAHAFYNCRNLKSVSIPKTVYQIGDYAFYGCSSLQTLATSAQFNVFGEYAFAKCTSLITADIPDGAIGKYAFSE